MRDERGWIRPGAACMTIVRRDAYLEQNEQQRGLRVLCIGSVVAILLRFLSVDDIVDQNPQALVVLFGLFKEHHPLFKHVGRLRAAQQRCNVIAVRLLQKREQCLLCLLGAFAVGEENLEVSQCKLSMVLFDLRPLDMDQMFQVLLGEDVFVTTEVIKDLVGGHVGLSGGRSEDLETFFRVLPRQVGGEGVTEVGGGLGVEVCLLQDPSRVLHHESMVRVLR